MPKDLITAQKIHDHVQRLQDLHPPVRLESVDREVRRPVVVRERYGHVIKYLARVELEVDRNVLELLTLLPHTRELDRFFYEDVWQPQEIQHGLIIDQLGQDIGLEPSEPELELELSMKLLGAISHLPVIGEVTRFLYYLTGASTERQAVLAYNTLNKAMLDLGEDAIAKTVIAPIKQQEPGHFAFYQMSSTEMVQSGRLRQWQLWLARQLRSLSYGLVGTNGQKRYTADMGGVMERLGITRDLEGYAREIGRLEARLLWADQQGLDFPPYVLRALRESLDLHRQREQAIAA
ncbi:GTP-binding protein LepA [Enemella dayhoffiae]|uniref:GTP-binding protein LepA n=1 Tax=Enemella dayhoffiae TaxID=2016507 RepID=A0A255H8R7_9ACTN|nr:GTP-binding protein LepA [Enemella dayhoffiae]OYO23907.1 GTP-binding protein LepA [Enemella dayhoffiae]